ncbi:hypothetical protein CEXT_371991 [Caerostris extrusa]|uniref:Uncharacterized protein n=1 Tax=Caerostris extrusa TaxID=172846 RepID=A0AAV4PJB7_CAEEX|nr:hypothetical protein CEXT_371991 [Caerostris extrusa]
MSSLNRSSPKTQPTCQKCFSSCLKKQPFNERTKEWRPQPNISTFRITKERRGKISESIEKIPCIHIQLFQSLPGFFHRQNNKTAEGVRGCGMACTVFTSLVPLCRKSNISSCLKRWIEFGSRNQITLDSLSW